MGTLFTYRGQLKNSGAPINGSCDIAFRLHDASSGGAQVGGALTQTLILTGSLLLGGVAINIVVPAYIDFAPYHAYGPMISR